MVNPLSTHTYDGLLDKDLLPSTVRDNSKLSELLSNIKNPVAIKYFTSIFNENISNIDSTTGLVADELLTLCYQHKDNPDFILLLEEQLIDMRTGFCPQGRTHRLYQLLLAFDT